MRISEIQLLSDDLSATARFYTGVLGLKQVYLDEHTVSFIAGASVLTFVKSENLSPVYHFAFNIPPLLLMEALAWTKARTVILPVSDDGQEVADFVSWNAKAFYYKDNNGNILEFIARYNLDVESAGPFDSSSIISISEIGIVRDDVIAERIRISETYGVPIFSKPPLPDNFTAIGDDQGLFILSKTHRPWHPNEVEARSYWSRTIFQSGTEAYELITETLTNHQ